MPVHIATVIIYQICRGLEHAHKHNVVHRDLKPANIMISNQGQVKILDFGVAHFQEEENLTSLGALLGTYHYMSPEQAQGKSVTPASDIFSLGILFYELLTGLKPFDNDDESKVLEKIVHKKARSVRKLNPAVPRTLNRIIKKCMRKNAKRRYENAEKIKLKLERYLKKYSIDHNAILKSYIENMSPTPVNPKWPPNLARRTVYRLTHQKFATYLVWLFVLAGIVLGERYLYSKEIKISEQREVATKFAVSLWDKVKATIVIPDAMIQQKKSDDQETSVDSTSDNSAVTP